MKSSKERPNATIKLPLGKLFNYTLPLSIFWTVVHKKAVYFKFNKLFLLRKRKTKRQQKVLKHQLQELHSLRNFENSIPALSTLQTGICQTNAIR